MLRRAFLLLSSPIGNGLVCQKWMILYTKYLKSGYMMRIFVRHKIVKCHTETNDGTYDISNKRRLGRSEKELVQDMIDGVHALITAEKAEA